MDLCSCFWSPARLRCGSRNAGHDWLYRTITSRNSTKRMKPVKPSATKPRNLLLTATSSNDKWCSSREGRVIPRPTQPVLNCHVVCFTKQQAMTAYEGVKEGILTFLLPSLHECPGHLATSSSVKKSAKNCVCGSANLWILCAFVGIYNYTQSG